MKNEPTPKPSKRVPICYRKIPEVQIQTETHTNTLTHTTHKHQLTNHNLFSEEKRNEYIK